MSLLAAHGATANGVIDRATVHCRRTVRIQRRSIHKGARR
jgi:hypothetical protein